jgi:hypothetical protein
MKPIVIFLKEDISDHKSINDIFNIFRDSGYFEYDARDKHFDQYQDYRRLIKSLEDHFPNDYIEYYGIIFTTNKDILLLSKLTID